MCRSRMVSRGPPHQRLLARLPALGPPTLPTSAPWRRRAGRRSPLPRFEVMDATAAGSSGSSPPLEPPSERGDHHRSAGIGSQALPIPPAADAAGRLFASHPYAGVCPRGLPTDVAAGLLAASGRAAPSIPRAALGPARSSSSALGAAAFTPHGVQQVTPLCSSSVVHRHRCRCRSSSFSLALCSQHLSLPRRHRRLPRDLGCDGGDSFGASALEKTRVSQRRPPEWPRRS